MSTVLRARSLRAALAAFAIVALLSAIALAGNSQMTPNGSMHTSTKFSGVKVNAGTVTHNNQGGRSILTLSADFVPPDTPDPHWQLVDSTGKVYLLDRLTVKGDRMIRSITVPDYVPDVAKVQIYCSWAEALLGEASFSAPLK